MCHRFVGADGWQAIIVNGQCGSGKTTVARSILEYMAYVSANRLANNKSTMAAAGKPTAVGTEAKVGGLLRASLTLLDAFGNAATLNNDDSSRYGKFVKLWFSSGPGINKGCIAGAKIDK